MFPPAHLDGCSVVVLRRDSRGFHVAEDAVFDFDGATLSLCGVETRRIFTVEEQESLMPVTAGSRIGECQGFDFFVLIES